MLGFTYCGMPQEESLREIKDPHCKPRATRRDKAQDRSAQMTPRRRPLLHAPLQVSPHPFGERWTGSIIELCGQVDLTVPLHEIRDLLLCH